MLELNLPIDPEPASIPRTNSSMSKPATAAPLTAEQIAIVKSTAPVLRQHGEAITTLFYKNMIDAHPELHDMFSVTAQRTGAQPRALAGAVLAYATYIDDLPRLRHAVERIAHKHASLHVVPAQYDVVGEFLLAAIGDVLGAAAATPAVVGAWAAAYAVLAGVFVARERALYAAQGDWVGFRRFRVARRVAETADVASFYLAPEDGAPLPAFLPGQYVSLQLPVPALGHLQSRQYSLSAAPALPRARQGHDGTDDNDDDENSGNHNTYRISVKRDEGAAAGVPGIISNMLHDGFGEGDAVELSHPQGEFVMDPRDAARAGAPLVLVGAGVGATPLVAMLNAATAPGAVERPVSWVHAARSPAAEPFAREVRRVLGANQDRVSGVVFYRSERPVEEGVLRAVSGGRLTLDRLDADKELFIGDARAEYYLCGSEQFMVDIRHQLEGLGVTRDRIYLELFATGDVPDDA